MYRLIFGLFLSLSLFISPAVSSAANLVPCGGPNEKACQTCDVVTMVNGIVQWLIIIMGTIAAIIIVYAGVKLVTSGGNSHAAQEAKSMMSNIIIGYIIVLAGWLIVDYIMKALVTDDPSATFGVWNQLTCTTQQEPKDKGQVTISWESDTFIKTCEPLPNGSTNCNGAKASCASSGGTPVVDTTVNPNRVVCKVAGSGSGLCDVGPSGDHVLCSNLINSCKTRGGTPKTDSSDPKNLKVSCVSTGGGGVQCNPGNTACSVAALQAAGMNSSQANVMSCIAMTESSGNPNSHSNSSSACGTFQIIRGTWAGAAPSSCSNFSNCTNASCNAQTAARLVRQSGYSSWTCPGCNNKAAACVSKFGG